MPRLALLTSGGDAPGMNCAIAAVTKVAWGLGGTVVGVQDGYDGLVAGRWSELTRERIDGIWHWGGTILGTARSETFRTADGRARAAERLRQDGVDALVVVGGNGSLTGAHLLARETGFPVVGLPASIDHDIACTSWAIGVDTALNTIMEACDRIGDTAWSHRRCFVVEVMGRQCGYLAMASAIGTAADAVLFREQGKEEAELVAELEAMLVRAVRERGKKRILVLKAEGVQIPTARLCDQLQAAADAAELGIGVRYTVLGHVVRGGAPTFRDRLVAGRLAHAAVWAVLAGPDDVRAQAASTGLMAGWEPREPGGIDTPDRSVQLFALDDVLAQTDALLDGSHPTTKARVKLLGAVQGVLSL
ncbi:MAG: 6-phosphofructokinase [Alphaproteobacteria bacterium]|nr:6-phosphofructokinase [Alphaproteobacteria bacterium]